MKRFFKDAALLFVALRLGDAVNLAAGMWFAPRYVSSGDIGALLPLTSFATFISLPLFAFAMTAMRESSVLHAAGEEGRRRTLLKGVFSVSAVLAALLMLAAAFAVPGYARSIGVVDRLSVFMVVASALLGSFAPVFTEALQSMKRFGTLGAIEVGAAAGRLGTMLVLMPLRPLAGYFAANLFVPLWRIAASLFSLKNLFNVEPESYWSRERTAGFVRRFVLVLSYLSFPMLASLAEQYAIRARLGAGDSEGYFLVSRFSDFLYVATLPLLLVLFPYTAKGDGDPGRGKPYVFASSVAILAISAAMAVVYSFCGESLMGLMSDSAQGAKYVYLMPQLTIIAALGACQVFFTNAEVSAGRFGFLAWFVPLHAVYSAALHVAAKCGAVSSLDGIAVWMWALALAKTSAIVFIHFIHRHKRIKYDILI